MAYASSAGVSGHTGMFTQEIGGGRIDVVVSSGVDDLN